MSARYASGKFAWGICDKCGFRCKYTSMRYPTIAGKRTGAKVCPVCFDPDSPRNFLPQAVRAIGQDAEQLKDPRPDTNPRTLHGNPNWLQDLTGT